MRIEELTLGDFGCFYEETLVPRESGLTVVAGPQRAGKTTLMEALRHVGYGIDKGADLPPPSARYDLQATVAHDGHRYAIEVDHFAEPRVTPIDADAPGRTARELFGGVRKRQYRQLYTISLDELRRRPASLGDADLSRILLGAGFGEASELPDHIETLGAEAYDIGRTTGKQGGTIRSAIKDIEAAVDQKEAAVDQVDEHAETVAAIDDLENRIEDIDAEEATLERERTRLEVVVTEADDYDRLRELRAELAAADTDGLETFPLESLDRVRADAERLEEARARLREERADFAGTVPHEDHEAYREALLDERLAVRRFATERSGYERDIEHLAERAADLEADREDLRERVADCNPAWSSLEDVRALETDLFSRADLREHLGAYTDARDRVRDLEADIETLEEQIAGLEERIDAAGEGLEVADGGTSVVLAGGVLVAVALGAVATLVHPLAGVGVTALVLAVVGVWALRNRGTGDVSHGGVSVEHLRAQRQEREADLTAARERKRAVASEREAAGEALEDVATAYDLPPGTQPETIERFYEELLAIDEAVTTLDQRAASLETDRDALREDLAAVGETLAEVGVIETEPADPLTEHETLLAAIGRASDHLEAAEAVAARERAHSEVESDCRPPIAAWGDGPDHSGEPLQEALTAFLAAGERFEHLAERQAERDRLEADLRARLERDRVAAAFESLDADDPLEAFETVLERHGSIGAVEDRLQEIESAFDDLEDRRTAATEELATLERRREDLASDEDVRAAHEAIQAGRTSLETNLESYARYRIAEYLLETLHDRYLERTTGPLLETASAILERITDGTYETVDSAAEFEALDFVATRTSGLEQPSAALSRATAEQVFLAVRLAKIRLADEPLPVLLDDSLTNFDPAHAHRTLEVVTELAADHQVILLTCHPTMLERVAVLSDATYWCLEDGELTGPSEDPREARQLLEHAPPAGHGTVTGE